MDNLLEEISKNLAQNVALLRKKRNLTQAGLAKIAGLPRSTLTYIESGQGNPSLQNLAKISAALQVSIEEMLSVPRGRYKLVKEEEISVYNRGQGAVQVYELLPDPIPGMHIDRMEFDLGGRLRGIPHINGTKEYLTCLQGEVTVRTGGETFVVQKGDVLAFPGDQMHSYENTGDVRAICVSVVVLAPSGV
jgi:XRE family transcriptional regulator, regulator of sulfur utilization